MEYLGASCHIKDLKFTSLEDGGGEEDRSILQTLEFNIPKTKTDSV